MNYEKHAKQHFQNKGPFNERTQPKVYACPWQMYAGRRSIPMDAVTEALLEARNLLRIQPFADKIYSSILGRYKN